MKLLDFPTTKLNSTRNIFEILKTIPIYSKLEELEDVICINIDSDNLHDKYQDSKFYAEWFNDNKFKVAIIHDVHSSSLPFLKVADHLVFFNQIQADVIEKVIELNTPYSVIPYPKISNLSVDKQHQVFFSADFNTELCDKYLHIANTWNISDDGDVFDVIQIKNGTTTIKSNKEFSLDQYPFIAMFNITQDELNSHKEFFDEFISILEITTVSYKIIYVPDGDRTRYEQLLAESEYSYIFNEEMATSEAMELIDDKSLQIIYTNVTENASLADSLSNKCNIIIAEGISTCNLDKRPTLNQYATELLNVIREYKEKSFINKFERMNSLNIDTWDNVHVIEGQQLSNRYVFVVNFRNQKSKIVRCINSITQQNKNFDFGIAITDDCSDDGSLHIVLEELINSGVDYIVTQNHDRKYSSRNLYNAVHLLVNNPESVIIELDGDDFLYRDDVLEIIDIEYSRGILKTCGNFITYPEKWDEMETNSSNIDISKPWHQGKCSAWLPMRSYKKHLFEDIEVEYFLDRETNTWLKTADDASINPRMIELANGKVSFLNDYLYAYDVSGNEHDVGDDWSPIPSYKMLYHIITF